MNIEVGEVGDLVYDPMTGDVGVITRKIFGAFDICWYDVPSGKLLRTIECHTDFVYHPEFDKRSELARGYCLAADKEKYYANR
jgi:hypothetical protein